MIGSSSQHTEKFRNLDITKVNIGIEGVEKVNALYASGMQTHNTYDQILKCFKENGVTLQDFLTEKYALCFDLRPSRTRLSTVTELDWKTPAKVSRWKSTEFLQLEMAS